MTTEQVLFANLEKRVRITFTDGIVWNVDIRSVEQEGFLHSGPDGVEPDGYWSRFDSVVEVRNTVDTKRETGNGS
jgi:hypothetical protein